jgi:hypothetical protein
MARFTVKVRPEMARKALVSLRGTFNSVSPGAWSRQNKRRTVGGRVEIKVFAWQSNDDQTKLAIKLPGF